MKSFFKNKKKINIVLGGLLFVVFTQSIFIAKLYSEKDDKIYEVNLVKINTQKDSIDYLKMKNDLHLIDQTLSQLNSFLKSKDIKSEKLMYLSKDSLSNSIYLAKQSNRYSQYLMNLQNKLMQVPLGMPSEGYISSNFGIRKNPIPFKTAFASIKSSPETNSEENVAISQSEVKTTSKAVTSSASTPSVNASNKMNASNTKEKNNVQGEAEQMQFHKGLDVAVAYGSNVVATAAGTVIFSGVKGGYGNCVIISHGNGLSTLYGHLSQLIAKTNDKVKVGQLIAKSGNTGRSTGPHLHYEVHKNNTPINPKLFMNL